MIKEALINPRKKLVSDLARSGMKGGQDNSFLHKIYDPSGQGGQKEFIKQKREAYSPYLPRYKKNQRSFSVKEKRASSSEVNQSQIAGLQEKIFADLENFEDSALIESGRSSQASIVQNYFEENPFSAGTKKFDSLPFGKDLDLFRQKFKRAFPSQPDKQHENKSPNGGGLEYKLRRGKVSLQVKPRTQSVYTHSIRTNLILKQFQNARSKQSKDPSKRTNLNTSESGIKKRRDLNQSFGPTHHNNSFLQKALNERNQSFDYPSKSTKTDISMDDHDEKCRSRSPLLDEKYIQKVNLGKLRSVHSKDNTSFYQPSSSKERIVKSFKHKHSDLDPMPVGFSSLEKDCNPRIEKRHHHRSLVMNEGETNKLKSSKNEYSDLLTKILHETEKPKYLDPEVAKQENKRKEWLAAFEEKKAQLRNYYKNLQQKKTREKLQTEPDFHTSKTIDRSFGDVSSIKSIFEPNQQPQQDFQPLPIGTSWGPSEIHKKYFLGGKNAPQRKLLLR